MTPAARDPVRAAPGPGQAEPVPAASVHEAIGVIGLPERLPRGTSREGSRVDVGNLALAAAVRVHHPQLVPPAPAGAEEDLLAVRRPGGIVAVPVARIGGELGAPG